jgi:hypothetical protein
VTVSVTASSANDAARLANAYADALIAGRRGQLRGDTEEALRTARRDLAALPSGSGSADARSTLRSRIDDLEAALALPRAGAERVGRARPPGAP